MNERDTHILNTKWVVERHSGYPISYYIRTTITIEGTTTHPFIAFEDALPLEVAEEIVTSHNTLVDLRAGNLPKL